MTNAAVFFPKQIYKKGLDYPVLQGTISFVGCWCWGLPFSRCRMALCIAMPGSPTIGEGTHDEN